MQSITTATLERPNVKQLLTGLCVGAGLFACAALHSALMPSQDYQPAFLMTTEAQERINTSPFAVIMGEFRASMADLMWIKTERYLHRGVSFAAHLEESELAHEDHEVVNEHGDVHTPEHDGMAALIPSAEHDYRWFIGELHREIHPWQGPEAPHVHTRGDELLPWYRLLTYSNPHHWRGYMIGSWWLSKQDGGEAAALREGLSFLEEGIANNPEKFQLLVARGRLLIKLERAEEALGSFVAAAELGAKVRPEGGKAQPPAWTDSDEEEYWAAVRYPAIIAWQLLDDPKRAEELIGWGLRLLPGDVRLEALEREIGQGH